MPTEWEEVSSKCKHAQTVKERTLGNHDFRQMDDLLQLEVISLKNKMSQLWIDCLIKPAFVTLKYICLEHEADWALHLNTVREMMPLFFATGDTHYA